MNEEEFASKLDTCDVPLNRRDISQTRNVAWLLRNLHVRNSENENFRDLIFELRDIVMRPSQTKLI